MKEICTLLAKLHIIFSRMQRVNPLLYRWSVPPVVIRCVHWTMQREVLQTWITTQSPAIVMDGLCGQLWSGDGKVWNVATRRRGHAERRELRSMMCRKLDYHQSVGEGGVVVKLLACEWSQREVASAEMWRPVIRSTALSPVDPNHHITTTTAKYRGKPCHART